MRAHVFALLLAGMLPVAASAAEEGGTGAQAELGFPVAQDRRQDVLAWTYRVREFGRTRQACNGDDARTVLPAVPDSLRRSVPVAQACRSSGAAPHPAPDGVAVDAMD